MKMVRVEKCYKNRNDLSDKLYANYETNYELLRTLKSSNFECDNKMEVTVFYAETHVFIVI